MTSPTRMLHESVLRTWAGEPEVTKHVYMARIRQICDPGGSGLKTHEACFWIAQVGLFSHAC